MTTLKPVILVREFPPSMAKLRHYLPSVRTLISATSSAHESEMIEYLSRGEVCCFFGDRGYGTDPIAPRRLDQSEVPFAGLDLTDGTWVWPGVLPYYVERYHLQLPSEFVRFALERGWEIDKAKIDLATLSVDALYAIEEPAEVGRT